MTSAAVNLQNSIYVLAVYSVFGERRFLKAFWLQFRQKQNKAENVPYYETFRLMPKTATLSSFILKVVHLIISVFNKLFWEQSRIGLNMESKCIANVY